MTLLLANYSSLLLSHLCPFNIRCVLRAFLRFFDHINFSVIKLNSFSVFVICREHPLKMAGRWSCVEAVQTNLVTQNWSRAVPGDKSGSLPTEHGFGILTKHLIVQTEPCLSVLRFMTILFFKQLYLSPVQSNFSSLKNSVLLNRKIIEIYNILRNYRKSNPR